MNAFYDPETYDLEIGQSSAREARSSFYCNEGLRLGGPILEIGCGTGNVLIAMARSGLRVVGIDVSEAMLSRCKAKLADEPSAVRERASVHSANMLNIDVGSEFAAIFLPYHVICHLLSSDELEACLKGLFGSLVAGGEIIFDVAFHHPSFLGQIADAADAHFRFVADSPVSNGLYRVSAMELYDPVSQLLTSNFRYEHLDDSGSVQATWYRVLKYRLASPEEYRLQLLRCGFGEVEMWRAFDRRQPLESGFDYVVRSRKAGVQE